MSPDVGGERMNSSLTTTPAATVAAAAESSAQQCFCSSSAAGQLVMLSFYCIGYFSETWSYPVWNTFLLGFDIFCKKLYFKCRTVQ